MGKLHNIWNQRRRELSYLSMHSTNSSKEWYVEKNYDGFYLRCLEKEDVDKVLSELHDGLLRGNFGGDTMDHKVLKAGYYCPTMFKDYHAYAQKCQEFQKVVGREKKYDFPLQLVTIERPFQQWGLDFIG